MTKGEDTRHTVLSAALSLASEVGLAGVTIGKLSQACGMSKSGLFAHFSSKENLQVQLLQEAVERFVERVVSPGLKHRRGEPRVRALFDEWLAWSTLDFMPGGCIFMAAAVELDDRPGPARDLLVASQRDWLETLAHAARIAVEEKHFRRDLDTGLFAHEVYSIASGHHVLSRLLADPKAEKRTRASFERLVADARVR